MTLSELLNKLATAAGVKSDDQALIDMLSNSEISRINVADGIATQLTSNLLTMDSAKNNQELQRHFKALALNPVDEKLNSIADELGLPDDIRQAFISEKNTYQRLPLLSSYFNNKIEQIRKDAKGNGADPEKEKAYKDQIDKLNADFKALKDAHQNELSSLTKSHASEIRGLELNNHFSTYRFPEEAEKAVNRDLLVKDAMDTVLAALEKQGGDLIRKDGKWLIVQKGNPEMEFYLNNEKVDFKSFSDSVLADHKKLAVSSGKTQTPGQPPITTGAPTGQPSYEFDRVISDQLKAIGAEA